MGHTPNRSAIGIGSRFGNNPAQKKIVRGIQLTVVLMVVTAVLGAIITHFQFFSWWHILFLVVASVAYLAWNIHGMKGAIALLLWDQGSPPPVLRSARLRHTLHFTIQLGLAAMICFLGDQGKATTLLWVILLPPIAIVSCCCDGRESFW